MNEIEDTERYWDHTEDQIIERYGGPIPMPASQAEKASDFRAPMTPEALERVNKMIQRSELITAQMTADWLAREEYRKRIAERVCPWRRGQILQLNDGTGPMDRRVVVGVVGGCTEEGEFYRVRTRVLAKGMKIGKREVGLMLKADLKVSVVGEFDGALPEVCSVSGKREI
ncbi:MAG: hypothetical protein WC390_08500 [Sulfurimonas sp.]